MKVLKDRIKTIILFFFFFISTQKNFSQSLRAGEIQYTHLSSFTYQTHIHLWSNDSTLDFIVLSNGGGTSDTLFNQASEIFNSICYNEFSGSHTYPSIGTYVASISANFLMDSIANIQFPTPQKFYLEDSLKILDPAFYGYDNLPVVMNAPVETAYADQVYTYNPNAFDPDGDSLSFALVPFFANGYSFPPATDSLNVNHLTGELTWDKPIVEGNYAIAMLITEWRLGIVMGTELVDMMIHVEDFSGINSVPAENSVSIFPNPTHEQTSITYNIPAQSQATLSILNLEGIKIEEIKLNPQQHQVSLNVSHLASGVYIIELRSSDEMIAEKLVKE